MYDESRRLVAGKEGGGGGGGPLRNKVEFTWQLLG